MLRFFLILLGIAVILGSSHLRSQEPYCELGYGACGGRCSEAGKKQWDCPAEALPCYGRLQRCSCEEAAICKPKQKKPVLTPQAPPAPTSR